MGVYHCFSRCVRRAFLCGIDPQTRNDYSHRKTWLVDKLRELAAIFAVEVCAFAVMWNHYHTILRTRPDIVATWSDYEVASRWLTLFPRHCDLGQVPIDKQIHALTQSPGRIATLRKRLSSLSWFMGRLNESIARAANKEDKVKGRFWESRFKCQVLLDEAAIAACMVYVDLNPIRAGLAGTPEESDFTSIQERIRAWQNATMSTAPIPRKKMPNIQSVSNHGDTLMTDNNGKIPNHIPGVSVTNDPLDTVVSNHWLCPISPEIHRCGILSMTEAEYFDLVDKSGRIIHSDKQRAIDADLAPILRRIGVNPETWTETISRFGSKFHLAAGLLSNLRNFANQLSKRWFVGIGSARATFALIPPRLA